MSGSGEEQRERIAVMLRKRPAGKSGIILGLFLVILVSGASFGADSAKNQDLMKACEKGNLEDVKRLLNERTDINAKDDEGQTALMGASGKGHAEVVEVLLAKGADINAKDKNGGTALMWASLEGQAEVVKVLLEGGADINAKDNAGHTSLMGASCASHAEVVEVLLAKGTDIDAKDTYGATSLMCASQKGHTEVVKVLLDEGADVNAKDNKGVTPLMSASLGGSAEVVKALLAKEADINAKDEKVGWTALMFASFKGHTEVVKVLLGEGADVNAKEKNGPTALEMASVMNHPEVVKLLKAHGAKETGESKSLSDELPAVSAKGADMWVIAVLLLLTFVLILFAKIAKTRRMRSVFLCLTLAVWCVVAYQAYLMPYDFYDAFWIFSLPFVFQAIADLIALPILRRRVIPPCVRVRRTQIYKIVVSFFCIAFGILFVNVSFSSPRMMLFAGIMTASMIIYLILSLSERVEVCGNGVWQYGGLHGLQWLRPWEEYESFSWKGETKDSVVLWLVPKSWRSWIFPCDRLLVAPEDREAVHQLLEANLPDLSK
jgi:ankyrin repeat protein